MLFFDTIKRLVDEIPQASGCILVDRHGDEIITFAPENEFQMKLLGAHMVLIHQKLAAIEKRMKAGRHREDLYQDGQYLHHNHPTAGRQLPRAAPVADPVDLVFDGKAQKGDRRYYRRRPSERQGDHLVAIQRAFEDPPGLYRSARYPDLGGARPGRGASR